MQGSEGFLCRIHGEYHYGGCDLSCPRSQWEERFAITFQATEGLKASIKPSPLESALNKISNNMQKSINGFLVKTLWPYEVKRFEALGSEEYRHIEYRRSSISAYQRLVFHHIIISNIRGPVYRHIGDWRSAYQHINELRSAYQCIGMLEVGISAISKCQRCNKSE